MKKFILFALALSFLACALGKPAQGQEPKPPSLIYSYSNSLKTLYLPHTSSQVKESQNEKNGLPFWAGFSISTETSIHSSGSLIRWPNGQASWMLRATSPGAPALAVVFEETKLPPNGMLFIYAEDNPDYFYMLSSEDVSSGYLTTPIIPYESIIIEYTEVSPIPNGKLLGSFIITDLVLIYNGIELLAGTKDLGESDWCQININCSPEGDNWQLHKRGVARLLLREGNQWGWCSGTLINNTNQDGTPYFLTAEHCGGNASTSDRNQWQFYFNYERPGCEDTGTPPTNRITGCSLVAKGPISGGSDFQLVRLSSTPPESWNPYYNGWDRNTSATAGGVGIHHPSGDVKKISTYNGTPISSSPNIGGDQMASGSAWRITWSSTENGHGVTEGGSSGSPILNSSGLVIGTLSGGSSYCDYPNYPDFYGKISYHWSSNGTTDELQLQPWLDPANTGVTFLGGLDPYAGIIPDFYANRTVSFIDEEVLFTDMSSGTGIESWSWVFGEGASPATATGQGPHAVAYTSQGSKIISLTINDEETITKEDYVFVKELIETELVFEQLPHFEDGEALLSAHSGEINYEVADNFSDLNGTIERVVVQGVYAYYNGSNWNACEPEQNLSFKVRFYGANDEQPDWSNPLVEFTTQSVTTTYDTWESWNVYDFELELPGSVTLNGDGWISVQSYQSQCWFLWFKSTDGDNYSYQFDHNGKGENPLLTSIKGSGKEAKDYDVAFQLWAREDQAKIISFDFEEDVVIDVTITSIQNNEATIEVTVELETDVTALTPIIEISEGATLNPTDGVPTDFSQPVIYTVTSEDDEVVNSYTVIVAERDLYSHALILNFGFDEDVVVESDISEVDQGEGTITVTVSIGTDVASLTPTITISLGATINYTWPTIIDFTNPVEFAVTAENGLDQSNYRVIVNEEPPTFTVTFSVVDTDDQPLTGAQITLGEVTNPVNDYVFDSVAVGIHNYSVELSGYNTVEGTVEVVDQDVTNKVILEISFYPVTFNVLVDPCIIDIENDAVYLTGSFTYWAEPGTENSIEMELVSELRNNILEEGFEGTTFPPSGWSKLNPDDGSGWEQINVGTSPLPGWQGGEATAAPEGGSKMAFASWEQGGSSSNDQWLITPMITVEHGSQLSFYLRYWPDSYSDNFDIRISTTVNNNVSAFSIIVDELNFGSGSSTDWELYSYNLTEYVNAGESIYIAFREYVDDNYNDGAAIMLDNVSISAGVSANIFTATVMLEAGEYEYKYFRNEGWDGGEWVGAPNRSLTVEGEMEQNDIWANGLSRKVTFVIKDENQQALGNAIITLGSITNEVGDYVFECIKPGTYVYSVSLDGYDVAEGEVVVDDVNVTITVTLIVGDYLNPLANLKIYPNPFDDYILISSEAVVNRVIITNIFGQRVLDVLMNGKETINTQQLSSGIYIVTLEGKQGKRIYRKMIKQ